MYQHKTAESKFYAIWLIFLNIIYQAAIFTDTVYMYMLYAI